MISFDMGRHADLVQDFRNFDFESPWEGILTLPGDEKAHADRQDMKRQG